MAQPTSVLAVHFWWKPCQLSAWAGGHPPKFFILSSGTSWASVWYPPLRIPPAWYKPSLVVRAKVLENLFLDRDTLSCLQLSCHLCGGYYITLLGDHILLGSLNSDEHQIQGCSSPLYKMVQNLNTICVHLPVSFETFLGYFKCLIKIEILCQ